MSHLPASTHLEGEEAASPWEERLLLLVALVVACGRFVKLGHWSLWYDEAITLADGHHALGSGEIHNPLGYLAVRATVVFLGGTADEFSLRLLPALVGVATVPLCYLAFRRRIGGSAAALAALLLAASPWHLYWSQNARFYTMAQALSLAGAGLIARAAFGPALSLRGSLPWVLGGAALVALAAAVHLSAGILLAALVVVGWVALPLTPAPARPGLRRVAVILILLCGSMALLRAGWALDAWRTYRLNKGTEVSLGATLASVAHFALTSGFWITPLLGAGFLVGLARALRGRDPFLLFAAGVVLVGAAGAACAAGFVRVSAQYVFVLLPWVALVAASPLGGVGSAPWPRAARRGYACVLVLPLLAASALYFTVQQGQRPRWRDAYQYVGDHARPGDLILGMQAPIGEYYLAPGRTDLRDPQRVAWLDKHRATVHDLWGPYARRVWFVLRPEDLEDWDPADKQALLRNLTTQARLVRRFPLATDARDLALEVWLRDAR